MTTPKVKPKSTHRSGPHKGGRKLSNADQKWIQVRKIELAAEMYEMGLTYSEIGSHFGISGKTIYARLKGLGVRRTTAMRRIAPWLFYSKES